MASPNSGGGTGHRSDGLFRFVPALTLILLLGPVAAGLAGALLPALGLTGVDSGPSAFRALFQWPGLLAAVRLSVTTGLAATVISLGIVVLILACWHGTRTFRAMERMLSPLLALPHVTAAFGLAFLIAPSGWLSRLVSPWATGWQQPPDLLIVQDPLGLALIAGLVMKEVPFLILMCLAAIGQTAGYRGLEVAAVLGYRPHAAWLKVVLPQLYPQIRLPVYAVLAYSMTTVDAAMILGPNTPPPLSVQIVRWMNDPNLDLRAQAAAAALLQLGLVIAAIALWRLAELGCGRLGIRLLASGRRGGHGGILRSLALLSGIVTIAAAGLGLAALAIWSVAGFWGFPESLPGTVSLANWQRHTASLADTVATTLTIAALSTFVSLMLVIGCLEAEHRHGFRLTTRSLWLLYLPLIIPQAAFLPGLQILSIRLGLTPGLLAVTAAHVVFVLPYVFLSLGDPYRAWNTRLGTVAAALGSGPDRILWRLRLPMLLRPILTAAAVGFAVSVGQYLPTLLVGGGRVPTLTTEALALAAGGDRRAIGVFGIALTVTVTVPFAIALAVPRLAWRDRRELRHA